MADNMKVDYFTQTEEQIIVHLKDESVCFIYVDDILSWSKQNNRMVALMNYEEGRQTQELIKLSASEYLRTITKQEIELFLYERQNGIDD
jgi:hypothetical protein